MKVKHLRKFCRQFGLDEAFQIPHPFNNESEIVCITLKNVSLYRFGRRKNRDKFDYHALVFMVSDLAFAIEIEQKKISI
jgi:hypothetical protein